MGPSPHGSSNVVRVDGEGHVPRYRNPRSYVDALLAIPIVIGGVLSRWTLPSSGRKVFRILERLTNVSRILTYLKMESAIQSWAKHRNHVFTFYI